METHVNSVFKYHICILTVRYNEVTYTLKIALQRMNSDIMDHLLLIISYVNFKWNFYNKKRYCRLFRDSPVSSIVCLVTKFSFELLVAILLEIIKFTVQLNSNSACTSS
jgi:hypothetical protein